MSEDLIKDLILKMSKLSTDMHWVILIGGFLIMFLLGVVGYQVNVNTSYAAQLSTNQQVLDKHLQDWKVLNDVIIKKGLDQ